MFLTSVSEFGIASPQRPAPPPRKQWFDKLADVILGDDDASAANAAVSRYALICEKCFAHNGLAKESVWEETRESLSSGFASLRNVVFFAPILFGVDRRIATPRSTS